MRSSLPTSPRDLYVGCFSDIHGWGGGPTAASGLIGAGRRRGLSTLLLGTSSRGEDPGRLQPDASRFNVGVVAAPLLWRFQSWRVIGQLQRHLRRLAPPHKAFVGISPYWVVAAKRAWPEERVIYLFPCLLSNCLPFTWPERRAPSFWKHLDYAGIRRAEHLAFDHADLTLTPTRQAAAEVLAFHPPARGRVTVCTYGCEPREIERSLRTAQRGAAGLNPDAFVCLVGGVCDLNKAFDWAIRELPATDEKVQLVVVGDGPQRQQLAHLAAELGVAERVRFVGSHRDMAAWYAAADAVLSTSYYDTFPNVVLEGMAHGRPVVVPQHDPPHVFAGVAEVVREGGAGLLYDRRRPGALAEALNRLVRDRRLATELGDRARSVARQRFSWDRCLTRALGEPATVAQPSVAQPPTAVHEEA